MWGLGVRVYLARRSHCSPYIVVMTNCKAQLEALDPKPCTLPRPPSTRYYSPRLPLSERYQSPLKGTWGSW